MIPRSELPSKFEQVFLFFYMAESRVRIETIQLDNALTTSGLVAKTA